MKTPTTPGISYSPKNPKAKVVLLNNKVITDKNMTTNKIGIKCVPTQVCLNFTPGIKFTTERISGSNVIPSRYMTNKNAVNTKKVPASGCNKIKAIGTKIIANEINTVLMLCCLMLTLLIKLASNNAVPILANSAG